MSGELRGRIEHREQVLRRFIDAECERLARACHAMAVCMREGGRLIAFGDGAAATDAAHVAVEFMHPVIVGKRALPAVTIGGSSDLDRELAALARRDDIALVLCHGEPNQAERQVVDLARRLGLLTIVMTGSGEALPADYCFVVGDEDPHVVQEVQETAYHVLWELVHVFLDQPAAQQHCITCGDVGVRAQIVAVHDTQALVESEAGRESVAVDLVGAVTVGDIVLCHAGVALEKL